MNTQTSQRAFLGTSSLLFIGSAAITAMWCAGMSRMDMPMPGGWRMSMAWMRMPGQGWPGSAASFLEMWTVMMVAMMLPCLVPMLWRYRSTTGASGFSTTLAGIGYFLVWTLVGLAVYPLGVWAGWVEMGSPAVSRLVPVLFGAVVLVAGLIQLSAWKARHLACCRSGHSGVDSTGLAAWRHGLKMGVHCGYCCSGMMAVLVVLGVMDLPLMAVLTLGMALERVLPDGEKVARGIGLVLVGAGIWMLARALGL